VTGGTVVNVGCVVLIAFSCWSLTRDWLRNRNERLRLHLSEFVDVHGVTWVGEDLAEEVEVWLHEVA
jgi:hypothetical protein